MIPLYCQKVKRREPVAEGEKDGLKLNIKKTKITASGTITSWQSLFLWAPKSVQTVTAAMKLKTLAPWKKSCDKPRQCIKNQSHHFDDSKSCHSKAMVFPVVMYRCELEHKV